MSGLEKAAVECIPSYTIIKQISHNVFLVKDEKNNKRIMKVISEQLLPFPVDIKDPLERLQKLTERFGDLGLGPKLIDSSICGEYLVLITECIQCPLTSKDLENKTLVSAIQHQIKRMHDMGIIHGDLHRGNVRYTKQNGKYNVYFIDPDTAFTFSEYYKYKFPKSVGPYFKSLDEFLQFEDSYFHSGGDPYNF